MTKLHGLSRAGNVDVPPRADLPTPAQLGRATMIAAAVAALLLVAVVLPSEYAIDPTRIGRLLGLTQMGETKVRLAAEAAREASGAARAPVQPTLDGAASRLDEIEARLATQQRLLESIAARLGQSAPAPAAPASIPSSATRTLGAPAAAEAAPRRAETKQQPAAIKSDSVTFTLSPGDCVEVKLVMRKGARADFSWSSSGGVVNVDTHGDAPGKSTTYERSRGINRQEGVIEAAFDGNHGWFWRNRTNSSVTVTLRTSGDYAELKRIS